MGYLKHQEAVLKFIDSIKSRQRLVPERRDDMCPELCTGFYLAEGTVWRCTYSDDLAEMPGRNCPHYDRQRENHVRAWLKYIGVPERYSEMPDEEQIQHVGVLRQWSLAMLQGSCSTGLVLAGGKGTGKTTTLGWLARSLWEIRRVRAIRFVFAPDLFDMLHQNSKAVYDWAEVDILFIDDYGREHASEFSANRWDSLVEKRYGQKKPTVLSTNLAPSDMDTESRWFDRLKEQCLWLRLAGSSKRSKRETL